MTAGCAAGALAASLMLAASLIGPAQPSAAAGTPDTVACPARLAPKATCYAGQDSHGAHYTVAVPHTWNGTLVMHAHGGPDLGAESDPERSADDLERWSVMVDEGYAWAGSAYRRGGYGTRMAAADTENLRRLFTKRFGRPDTTLIHGQSWGGNVAAKTIETYGAGPGSPMTARCSPTVSSRAARVVTTTGWTCVSSTSTTAGTIRARRSLRTPCGWASVTIRP